MKLLGFIEMKKTVGKVLFVVEENAGGAVVGHSTDKLFFYGDNSKKIGVSHRRIIYQLSDRPPHRQHFPLQQKVPYLLFFSSQ